MFEKNSFFNNHFINSKKYNENLKKTKKVFSHFLDDLNNNYIPLLKTFEKDYKFSFSDKTIKKFSNYGNIIIIGMGGSILGTKSIYFFLKNKIKKNVFFFDNLDINLNLKYQKIKNINDSCFIVVSKSGNTLETIVNLSSIFLKKKFKNKLVIVTEIADNSLMAIAKKYQAEIIEHKKFVGGRYSVLSEAGMFPASLMGLKIKEFKNLSSLIQNNKFVSSLMQNVASIYSLNLVGVKNSVIINYDSDANYLSYWYQQLVAESLGKKGKGITPIVSFGPKDQHSLLQLYLDGPKDKFFTFFNFPTEKNNLTVPKEILPKSMSFLNKKKIKFIIDSQSNSVKKIFKLKKIPYREINIKKKNEEALGNMYCFFVLETILLSKLMGVNPFDQPAVEQVKILTKKFLI